MKIALLRLPIQFNMNETHHPGGCISALFYNQWLTRYPPLGLLYYGALLKQKNHQVKLIDAELTGYSLKKISDILKDFNPAILCSSVNIFSPKYEFDCLKILKDDLRCTVICRGHFPRLYPEETIKNEFIDFAFTGKGFSSILGLTEALEEKKEFNKVNGIIYRDGNDMVKTPEEPPYDLDSLPFPARELVDNSIYTTALTTKDRFTVLSGSVGCPYHCTYCQDKNIPFQLRDIDQVIAEMKECKDKFNINEVFFFDSTFTIDRQRAIDFCSKLIKAGLKMSWVIRTRPDLVDEELLDMLIKAGCVKIHYGIESGDQKILDRLKRNIQLKDITRIVQLTAKKKIAVFGYFMIGNDGETVDSIKNTIAFAKSLPLHFAQFMKVGPAPGTGIFESNKEKLKLDLWLENYKGRDITGEMWKPQNTGLSLKQLDLWTNRAYRSFYLRPSYLWRMLNFKYTPLYIARQFKILFLLLRIKLSNLVS
ncbi:MAG: B12-binding domain-containing radical SAM protein [Candidatus Omnitrophica bacterium]|nr:B12-binding domain-containing radical SAM protein [Candidatus Omnitrophota bacterium]